MIYENTNVNILYLKFLKSENESYYMFAGFRTLRWHNSEI